MDRIKSLDALRGFSLLGILLLNIVSFGLPFSAYMNPTVYGGATGLNLATWFVAMTLWEGKMRAIFSLLFAASADLLLTRVSAAIYYRRSAWLILIGLLHAHLIWSGDILYPYGVIGLLLYPLRRFSARQLIIAGVVIIVLHSAWNFGGSLAMRDLGKTGGPEWDQVRDMFAPTPASVNEQIRIHRGGYLDNLYLRSREAFLFEFPMFFQFLFLDVLGMFVLGLGLARAGVFNASRSVRFYSVITIVGFALGIPLNYWAAAQWANASFKIPEYFQYVAVTADPGRLLVAAGYIGLVMLLCKAGIDWIINPLAAVGKMALSNYLLTSNLLTLYFNGYGLGCFAHHERAKLYWLVLAMWAINLAWSPLWLRRFQYGPAEWLWRSLTYWKRQPFRRLLD
ncbi:MAG: DUF418 domain-containing protein [Acidobacteria bacterium]|nr:DUF418 domain-containing protein [Acidobacteriota bacterium]